MTDLQQTATGSDPGGEPQSINYGWSVTYFSAVRLYSAIEATVFTALLVAWIGGFSRQVQEILGWTHGVGWLVLCVLVYRGARRSVFPWWLLAATVTPLGPLGSTAGFEVLARRRPTHVP